MPFLKKKLKFIAMKLITTICLVIITFYASAQFIVGKKTTDEQQKTESDSEILVTRSPGDHLILSGKFQYGAIACTVATATIYLVGTNWAVNEYPNDLNKKDELMQQFTIISIATGLVGAICLFTSINHKMMAGKALNQMPKTQAYIGANRIGVRYSF